MSKLAGVFRPRSLFAHILFWAMVLLILSNAIWLVIIRLADDEPRARHLAQLSASAVNLVRMALVTAAPDLRSALLQELSDREGIRLLPLDPHDEIEPLPKNNRFLRAVSEEIKALMGEQSIVSLKVNQNAGFWISFALESGEPDDFWLILPYDRVRRTVPWLWMGWGTLTAVITFFIAWLLASRVSRHLTRMADAARQVGEGRKPQEMPETGPNELQSLAMAFNRMLRDLAQHEQERAEILAGISHDLRTPLARLRLEAELSINDESAREGVAADIMQMDNIIGQFLEYARGEQEEEAISTHPAVFLAEVVRRANAADEEPVVLALGQLPALAPCLLKPRSLTRALDNLLSNARKYGAPPFVIGGTLADGFLKLTVSDRGVGIPVAEIERLKRPFTRLETARSNVGGTGLGLAIVERIAKAHGGTLELMPGEDGIGLIARLTLPYTPCGKGFFCANTTDFWQN
ncbi:MAG: HAMP domain-containing protein [Zoogloeaceae bacterium]|nr:HAMP domain-containing protein [Zoogloeaceae bacterium]